jgi:hypothetical protein
MDLMISPGEVMIMGLLLLVLHCQIGALIGRWTGFLCLFGGLALAALGTLAELLG